MSIYTEIDKQLHPAARVISLYSRPSLAGFHFVNRTIRLSKGQNIKKLDSSTVMINRSKGEGSIRTRVYKPHDIDEPLPIVLYLHGGGYAFGIPEQSTASFKALTAKRPCIIVAPDYRLSLTDPYPAGLDDCYDSLLWIQANAENLGGRSDQIFVIGDSAGGGLTAALSLLARDRAEVNIAFQMPLYPMLDDRQNLPSAVANRMPAWNSKHNKLGWELYLRDFQDKEIPTYAAPSRATNYSKLPPTATFIGSLDLFLDETKNYVKNLKEAGISVDLRIFPNCFHGFEVAAPQADVSKEAKAFLLDSFAHAVDNYFAPQ